MIWRPPGFVLTSLEPPRHLLPSRSKLNARSRPHRSCQRPCLSPPLQSRIQRNLVMLPSHLESHRHFKRWLQTRFKKTNKNQASQPPDQLSTQSDRPVNPRFDFQSEPTANITTKPPSRMAATQRARVSIFFFGRQQVCGMSDEASQRTVAKPVNWVRYSVCPLALYLSCVTA